MALDMTLATSYKPVLVCIAKVCVLMAFHYASAVVLFITERYAVIVALLYVDHWLAHEYIVNTNSCVTVLAGSLLVHELRDAGVQERLHGNVVHNVVLALLVACNLLVLVLGDHPAWAGAVALLPGTAGGAGEEGEDTGVLKKMKLASNHSTKGAGALGGAAAGPLVAVLSTSCLLVVLSTCSLPVSPHDPLLNNGRVWAFVALSLSWMYTVNSRELRYCSVAAFTPCVLRFSFVLFLTPAPVAVVGVALVAACLGATTMCPPRAREPREEGAAAAPSSYSAGVAGGESSRYSGGVSVVAAAGRRREPSAGSAISYRTPQAPATPKLEGVNGNSNSNSNSSSSSSSSIISSNNNNINNNINNNNNNNSSSNSNAGSFSVMPPGTATYSAGAACAGVAVAIARDDADALAVDPVADIDYNSLFEQTLNEQSV